MKAFIYDTETSGLPGTRLLPLQKQPHIIEFYGALVDLQTGEVTNEIDVLIKPPIQISDEITRITGLTNAMLQDQQPFSFYALQIRDALETAPAVLAHNASFDVQMIDVEMERLGETIKWPRLICSVEATVATLGYRLSLTALHEYLFNESFPSAHRAKTDVQALTRCAIELHKRGDL